MITVNGETYPWQEGMTVSDALKACNYKFPLIIVRIDGRLIPRDQYAVQPVEDNADIKAFHLISGG